MAARKKLRVGYLRISQETNHLSPVKTELADFRRAHFIEDPVELARATSRRGREVPAFVKNAELSGFVRAVKRYGGGEIELVPMFSAWAVSGGPLSDGCFGALRARLAAALAVAGPLDGLYFEGIFDPEAALLEVVRARLGPGARVACSMDLHAQLTREKIALTDVISGYRTNPHRDHAATGLRAGRMLVRQLRGELSPTVAWRALPMVWGGGMTLDFLKPMRPIFRRMKRLARDPRVADLSLFMCHIWNDHPELGWAPYVVTHDDQPHAEAIADELADLAWAVRKLGPPEPPEAPEAIAKVRRAKLRRKLGTACVCDVSDVVGAGATGENTRLLDALLRQAGDLVSYVPIRADQVVEALWERRLGDAVEVTVGGHLHPEMNPPLTVSGTLLNKKELDSYGRIVVLDLGSVKLCVMDAPPMVMKPSFYRKLGLEPLKADITVVKSLFPFRLYFLAENRLTLYAKTKGITDFDAVTKLDFAGPVYPQVDLPGWRAEDARRRGLST
ncbi:MAG: hypothetical protein CSA66_05765 [Proteobacteria bacterium]|nr:MAG: hypothetical protein CSA66_05765 [Pseudomonadota bacterium]